MSNKEYSTPVIVVTRLNETDIITASMGKQLILSIRF